MSALSGHPLGPFSAFGSWAVEAAVVVAILAGAAALGAARLDRAAAWLLSPRDRSASLRRAALSVVATLVVGLVAGIVVLDRFPNSADEYGDLFLAETLSAGRLYNPVPAHVEFFSPIHIAAQDGKWVARYPPGWGALIAAAGRFEVPPWALNPLLAALTILLVWRFAERFVARGTGPAAALLTLACGFFVFHAGSYRTHVSAGLWILAGAYLLAGAVRDSRMRRALLAGLAFGIAFLTRPFTTLLCALPLAGHVVTARGAAAWKILAMVGVGAIPGVGALLAYNDAVTGHPLLMVTTWMDPEEGLGFRHEHTLAAGLGHAARRLAALAEWANPAMVVVSAWATWKLWRTGRPGLFAWAGLALPALVVGHVFYHAFGGTQYGPRFYFEAWPLAVLAGLAGLMRFDSSRQRRALVVGLAFALVTLPIAAIRLHTVVYERQDVYRVVEAARLDRAVVLLSSPTGVGWPMPVQDLLRNGIELNRRVLFAHDRGADNAALRSAMPDRDFYRYVREPDDPCGRLDRLP